MKRQYLSKLPDVQIRERDWVTALEPIILCKYTDLNSQVRIVAQMSIEKQSVQYLHELHWFPVHMLCSKQSDSVQYNKSG